MKKAIFIASAAILVIAGSIFVIAQKGIGNGPRPGGHGPFGQRGPGGPGGEAG